ncbi:MAG: hypothetical protein KKE86_10345 [Planctomycetes bacterium]|nr:hypothetical protein [Planctomycetota bacterium]
MVRSIVFILLAGGLVSLCAATASAGEAVLGQEYGSGVHAFFTGDNIAAHERLTAAIKGGSKDPRAFYFRGLVYLKLGRGPEAAMDFRHGAELESKDLNRFYNVGKALERVQGEARIELERYRVEARMAALEEVERIRKARYEAIRREEARVLREQALAAPEEPIKPAPATPAEADNPFAVPEEENPFAVPEKKPAAQPDKKPAAKPPAEENPFADEAEKKPADGEGKKDDKPAEKKPADGEGKKDDKPAEEKPAEKKPADEKKDQPDDPFAFAP